MRIITVKQTRILILVDSAALSEGKCTWEVKLLSDSYLLAWNQNKQNGIILIICIISHVCKILIL